MSKKQTYTDEFKAEAVKLIDEHDGNVSAAARSLGIAMQTLSNWKTKSEDGRLAGTDGYDEKHMALLEENKKLKRQLKTAQMERDILKKATAYFAKESQ